ncbi:hypothetical protein SAMN04490197_3762 [Pseudomonas orientalis]|uniref:Uncharacterized protein n=1 Tax=Pseudomonas orientalis TaxID=76758 RepID=A0A8B3Y0K8_9PSED|nr:hypothetical protein SAMN04490197_3762 [Pseudomonas orientalis]
MYGMVIARYSNNTRISFTGFSTSDAFDRNHLEGDRGL